MAAKRGKRKASASPENGGLAGSSGSTTTMVWTMEDAKKALLKVKVTEADEQGVRKVGKNSLAEAIHGSATPGKVGWSNVMRRGCALPLPESSKFQLEGSKQTADVFHPSDVPGVVRKLLGLQGGLAWFQNTSFVSGVKTLMTTCGWSDFSKLEAVLEAVQVQVRQREAELAAFEVPALSDGSTRMRLHTNARGRVLISAHDELKWLGLDDDGKHNEWTHWLCSALEDYIKGYHHSSDSRSDDTPCLEYVKLDSESIHTPIIDKKCFQKVIWLFIGKSKLAGEHAEKALDIYGRYIVGDSRLDEERAANAAAAPKEAKDFVLGPEEATRQESLRSGASEGALKQWLSERLDTLERRVDASATLGQVSRQHGVLEITRSRVSSTSEKLLSIGTPIDDSQLDVVAAEGAAAHQRLPPGAGRAPHADPQTHTHLRRGGRPAEAGAVARPGRRQASALDRLEPGSVAPVLHRGRPRAPVRGLRRPPHQAGSRAAPDELPASEERRAGDRSQANRPIQPCDAGELVVGFGGEPAALLRGFGFRRRRHVLADPRRPRG